MISISTEDYLRAIDKLYERSGKVRSTEIASYLSLAKSSVSEKLKEMAKEGLVKEQKYAAVELTKKGRELGRQLTYKHRIIEVFLHKTLKMPLETIHEEAHRLEHAFSDEAITLLSNFLGNPTRDPHGTPMPEIRK